MIGGVGSGYHGDAYIADAGNSVAGAVAQYFQDRNESQGLDTALQTLGAAHANDQDFQQKFVPVLAKAGGMSLSQKRNVAGQIAGYLGQRVQEKHAAQVAKYQDAQIANMQADNERAAKEHGDRMASDEAIGRATRAYVSPLPSMVPEENRFAFALGQANAPIHQLPKVITALHGLAAKPEKAGLEAGSVIDLGDGRRLIGAGPGQRPFLDTGEGGLDKNFGKGVAVTDGAGNPVPNMIWVPTTKGGGQIIHTGGGAPSQQTISGQTFIQQPNGQWLQVRTPQVSEFDKMLKDKLGEKDGAAKTPASGINYDEFLKFKAGRK